MLLSWAVTRGPSTNPAEKRLAVRTEDHPFDHLTFEGTIPKGNYGAGTVMLWDVGWCQPFHDVDAGLFERHLHFALHGRRATAAWSLVRMKTRGEAAENWLMVKDADTAADKDPEPFAKRYQTSVTSNRSLSEIADSAPVRPFGPDRRGAIPRFRTPQFAETVANPPDGETWLQEVKLDGYRAQIAIGARGVRVRTRSGFDWTEKFSELLPAVTTLDCATALIDGEVIVGAGSQALQACKPQ